MERSRSEAAPRRARRDDDESASAFLKRLGMHRDDDEARAQSFASGSFKRDFLERLAQAEQRDEASEVAQQQISAEALDAMLLVRRSHTSSTPAPSRPLALSPSRPLALSPRLPEALLSAGRVDFP